MCGCRQSYLASNSKLIQMNEELAGKLCELGRQMNDLVREINGRIADEAAGSSADDRLHSVGC